MPLETGVYLMPVHLDQAGHATDRVEGSARPSPRCHHECERVWPNAWRLPKRQRNIVTIARTMIAVGICPC
ncbi:MAG TPA: hypothetical protein VLI39_15205 [Sedimentisphaerales bacterium]|nr:hypothetical protein [Sedimentisphaerales bacterium]